MLFDISAKAEEEMKQTRLHFHREFCSVHARNLSLFSLGLCGYFDVTLDRDPGFFGCYFWGAIIIPNSICFLFLTVGFFFFFNAVFLRQQGCPFSLLLAQPEGEGDLCTNVYILPLCLSRPYVILPALY